MCVPRRFDHRPRDPGIGVGLADADEPFIGMDLDDEIVLRRTAGVGAIIRHQQHEALDLGDLHARLFPPLAGGAAGGSSERQSARRFSSSSVRWQRMRSPHRRLAPRRPLGFADLADLPGAAAGIGDSPRRTRFGRDRFDRAGLARARRCAGTATACKQAVRIGMEGRAKICSRRADLHQLAAEEHATRSASIAHHGEIVRDEQHRRCRARAAAAAAASRMLACTETSSADRISSQSRSVGFGDQRAGDGDALALAARKLVGKALGIAAVEPHVVRAPAAMRARDLVAAGIEEHLERARQDRRRSRARGLSDASGFWKMYWIIRRSSARALARAMPRSGSPLKRMLPGAAARAGR